MRTTVILTGAGSSIPFGYPSGLTLRAQILSSLSDLRPQFYHTTVPDRRNNKVIPQALEQNYTDIQIFKNLGFDEDYIATFSKAFRNSGVDSIDSFLETNSNYLNIGKAAIANAIHKCERPDNVFEDGSWLRYLWNIIRTDIKNLSHVLENLKIITFNYDRL